MRITFNPYIKLNNFKKYPAFQAQKPKNEPLEKDIFVSNPKTLEQAKNDEKYQAIYDDVYDEVIEQNIQDYCPALKNIPLNKPAFQVLDEFYLKKAEGAYFLLDNSIQMPRSVIDEDYYCYFFENEDGEDQCTSARRKQKFDEVIKELQEKHPNGQIIKFTDKEKSIYISGLMAHELRHFIQMHLVSCADDTSGKAKKIWIKKSNKALSTLNKAEKIKLKHTLDKGLLYEKKKYEKPYFKTYEPKKISNEEAKILFSLFSEDEQYIDAKEFLNSEIYVDKNKKRASESEQESMYLSDIREIDAFNYGYEYILSKLIKEMDSARAGILLTASVWQKIQANSGLEYLQNIGYNPFISKKNS